MKSGMPWWDNVSDHRAGTARTIDRPFQNHAQVGLRVHRIVIQRCVTPGNGLGVFRHNL